MICGEDDKRNQNAVIIELKQWNKCTDALGEHLLTTWTGGAYREVLHPSSQVLQYKQYLADSHTAFHDGRSPINLEACAYLHNYHSSDSDILFKEQFKHILQECPSFTADDVAPLTDFLVHRLKNGNGLPVLRKVEQSKYRPSKKLMDHVSNVIKGESGYVLLDEQKVVYEKVLGLVREGFDKTRKQVIIVHGGPGTGKSVIAINLMSNLLTQGKIAHYATGSRAFNHTLWRILGNRSKTLFKYFNNYKKAGPNELDVLICDEAHRIRKSSNDRFTKKDERSTKFQIEELLHVAKVPVFFIDDAQSVRPNEIGSSGYIREAAQKAGYQISEYELEAQFRCSGSDGFVNWINNTLGIQKTANILWNQSEEAFDFRIFGSPEALENAIRSRASGGFTARMTAGFCWKWSDPNPDGTLINDVIIGDYQRPWNAKGDARRLAPGIPKEVHWAHDPNGIGQIGCIYTAQGFEFDYVGVIFGSDLTYDLESQSWNGNKEQSHDTTVKRSGERFTDLVKNTYRVLLSRGMKGCYVYFMDKNTELFFKSRMEGMARVEELNVIASEKSINQYSNLPYPVISSEKIKDQPGKNIVPLYDLKIAAGKFGKNQAIDEPRHWVVLDETFKSGPDLFVAQVIGESMNQRIPNGSWCLFRFNPAGTRQGKVVVAQHMDIQDPDTGAEYTVKVYESHKATSEDGTWRHERVLLKPDTRNPGYKPIEITGNELGELKIIAELVAIL